MTDEKEINCIICPIGCKIKVKIDKSECQIIQGDKCKQGREYAISEALDPRRMMTTSILLLNGKWPLVSIKSSKPVPKDKIFNILNEIKKIIIYAPVKSGQVIIENVANTGVNIIATKTIEKKE